MRRNKILLYLCVILPILVMVSCNSSKYIYFYEDKELQKDTNFYLVKPSEYRLQTGDILDVQFHSSLSDVEGIFRFSNVKSSQTTLTGTRGESGAFFYGYMISDSGTVRIPLIGHVHLENKNLLEAEKIIQKEAQKYVNDVIIKVRLYGIKITFMGDFKEAGTQYFYKNKVHLLDAVSRVPVLGTGDCRNIRIMRQTPEGIISYRVDLTDRNLIEDKKFYLQPNDIVYAEPRPLSMFRKGWSDYTFLVGTITSTLALIVLIVGTPSNL
ncbi:MAG: polysaccharide biosynthesis/export family protein [Bacteroidales bacterium]|nr:polysaccharide biosynthesis/export family protein [Bacteroidales bacterium]